MTSSTIPVDVRARRLAQNTFRIGLATAGVMALVSIASYLSTPNWLGLLVPVPMVAVGLVVAALARFGRARLGAWLLIGVILALTVVGPLTSTGQGFVYAVVSLVMMAGVAAATLPDRWAGRLVLPSIGVAALAVLVDLFGPPGRPVPANPLVGYAIAGGVLLAYLVVLARQFSAFPLRVKLILGFVMIGLLAASAVAFFANRTVRESLARSAAESLQATTRSRAHVLGDLLAAQADILRGGPAINQLVQSHLEAVNQGLTGSPADIQAQYVSIDRTWQLAADTDPLVRLRLENTSVPELEKFLASFPDHVDIFVTDRYGGVAASPKRTPNFNYADEGWWQAAWNGGQGAVYVGQPRFDQSSNLFAVDFAVPIRPSGRGAVLGILHTTYRLRALDAILTDTGSSLIERVELYFPDIRLMIDDQGILRPLDPNALKQLTELPAGGLAEFVYEGEPNYVTQSPVVSRNGAFVDTLGWRLVGHQNTEIVLAPAEQQTRGFVLLTTVIVLAAALVAAAGAQVLSAPIQRLTSAAERLAAGDLAAQVPVTSADEIGVLGRAFNQMARQIHDLVGTLERRVAERTRALNTSAEVSRRLSSVLDPKQLVVEVAEQLREAFNYYHAHIYLLDEAGQSLVMAGGTGEAGRAMLARGHKIAAGRGLVGRAAVTGQAVLVPDTAQDPGWLPNPLLPDTKAEVAVPILAGGQVVGVLDVQQNVAGGLTQADADLLQSIASQVGVALQNARAYEQTRRQASRDALITAIGQRLQGAATVEQVLKISAQELAQALTARRASVQIAADGAPSAGPTN